MINKGSKPLIPDDYNKDINQKHITTNDSDVPDEVPSFTSGDADTSADNSDQDEENSNG